MSRLSLEKVLDRATEVAREVAAPDAARVDAEATWPERSIRALLDQDLGGLVVPEEHGGCGYGLRALAQLSEVLGTACASTSLCFGMHCVGAAVIAARATPEQATERLELIAAGEHLTTLALSEPGTGSHFWLPETTAAAFDGGYRLRGRKTFVTNGSRADSYVLSTVAADPAAPPGMFSFFVVDAHTRGLEWGPPWRGIGMRGNSSLTLEVRDAEVPRSALLGAEGDEIWYVFNVVTPYFLVAMAGTYLGVAAGALETARLHVAERRYTHDGTRLAQNQVLQHRLGTMWATVERTRRLLWFAADEGDRGGAQALPALASAKAEVADAATSVINDALTLAGGIGYREGSDLDRRMRDARAAHVMAPTTDMLRTWAGRAILGENLLSE